MKRRPSRIGKSPFYRDEAGERFTYVNVYGKKKRRRNYTNF